MIVMKKHNVGEVVVILNNISQINHRFISFVFWDGESVRVIGYVDMWCPVRLPERRVEPS